jgi:hypothetical protein
MGPAPAIRQIALLGLGMSNVLLEQLLTEMQHLLSYQKAFFLERAMTSYSKP